MPGDTFLVDMGVRGFPAEHLVTPDPCTSAAPLTVGVVGSCRDQPKGLATQGHPGACSISIAQGHPGPPRVRRSLSVICYVYLYIPSIWLALVKDKLVATSECPA